MMHISRYRNVMSAPFDGLLRQCLLALCVLIFALASNDSFARYSYDRNAVMAMVAEEARAQGVDPALALAVAEVESNFNPIAKSPKGARGVMQIMPRTARATFGIDPAFLYNPGINIQTGIQWIKQLSDSYGRLDIALSHYNGGSRVLDPGERLRVIPATQRYVDKVLARADYYRARPAMLMANYEEAKKSLLTWHAQQRAPDHNNLQKRAQELRELRQKNLRLASVVSTWVDPYLRSYNERSRESVYSPPSKRAEVLKWESIYRN